MKTLQIRLIEGPTHEVEKEANILLGGITPENLVSVAVSSGNNFTFQKMESWESSGRPIVSIVYVEDYK